jgi:hypothetical protein
MKPLFTHIGKTPQESLIIVKRDVPYFDTPFHFHPECELVYIISGTGKRIIGDSIEVFTGATSGPNIPHVWYSDLLLPKIRSAFNGDCSIFQQETL